MSATLKTVPAGQMAAVDAAAQAMLDAIKAYYAVDIARPPWPNEALFVMLASCAHAVDASPEHVCDAIGNYLHRACQGDQRAIEFALRQIRREAREPVVTDDASQELPN